jgi:hypothetical protein
MNNFNTFNVQGLLYEPLGLILKIVHSAHRTCIGLISGFRRDVDVMCGLLGDYTAS